MIAFHKIKWNEISSAQAYCCKERDAAVAMHIKQNGTDFI